jgi:hypothetical protein
VVDRAHVENPRSATHTMFDRVQSPMSSGTWRINAELAVFPGLHHTRTGIPSRVTAIPTTTCGRSSRESLDFVVGAKPHGVLVGRAGVGWIG